MEFAAATFPTVTGSESASKQAKVSFRVLLGIYAIVPAAFVAYLLDFIFLNSYLQKTLPRAPESYLVLSLVFGTPHIIASNIIFLSNREYLRAYWLRAVLATVAIFVFFGIVSGFLSNNLIFGIVATTTVIHVVKQQIGIGNFVAQLKGWIYQVWMWTIVGASVVMFNAIFLQRAFTREQLQACNWILLGSSIVIALSAFILQFRAPTRLGKRFLWANTILILLSFFFYYQKYYFFAILGPRLVHDASAFIFYVVHDYNRHHEKPQNGIYRVLKDLKVNAFVAVPALALLLTLFLQEYADRFFAMLTDAVLHQTFPRAIAISFVGYLGMMHYYMESFTWKRGSPYRKYIAFSF